MRFLMCYVRYIGPLGEYDSDSKETYLYTHQSYHFMFNENQVLGRYSSRLLYALMV